MFKNLIIPTEGLRRNELMLAVKRMTGMRGKKENLYYSASDTK